VILGPLWDFVTSTWVADIIGLIGDIRALVHGAFLDSLGIWWSLGVPTLLVVWKWLAKIMLRSRQ
jgi:hypothetical protein